MKSGGENAFSSRSPLAEGRELKWFTEGTFTYEDLSPLAEGRELKSIKLRRRTKRRRGRPSRRGVN